MEASKVTGAKKLKSEIERRTRDTARLIEIETQKLAVGEMVVERLDTILDLLRAAGFKVVAVHKAAPQQQMLVTPPPNTVVVQASAVAPEPAQVKNPCAMCGQEAAYDEPMPDGGKKYYCRPHGQARMREKAEDAQTTAVMGSTGTMFARPKNPATPQQPQKTIIQADATPDLLKGPFPNGAQPPPNNVLDDD